MNAYEKLGAFYLGRRHDLETGRTLDEPLLYDSKDLTTHGVCVGMTGSGKTGLCISLLEEAAIDGIPAILIDPKGDLGNLLLTFPELRARDFEPWINADDARRAGVEPAAYAGQQAELWRNGLAAWDQDGDRIRRLREAADVAIYTPGSEAGLPVSILSSFGAPPAGLRTDGDLMRERVATAASSLLGLMGLEADPIRSREHILLSTVLATRWRRGEDLDLAGLIQSIQTPPVERVGVLELDSFYPAKERFELAMRLNNLLAAPGFEAWLRGESLEIQNLLYTDQGKPRLAIFSIAHLSETERMFFVSLLLNQVLGWMRTRPGTNSLRALIYMDEIFGFAPPSAEPPSKRPLLTLLKQARAYGVGVLLATQNPVDLDYKGLSNTGTWFLGRLQTERDKQRVLEGLEGAGGGAEFDRGRMERVLAGLGKRVFLMHNVHDDHPEVFHTRWAMSYLRGPLTRQQIKVLMDGRQPQPAAATAEPGPAPRPTAATQAPRRAARPVLRPGVRQLFLPLRTTTEEPVQYRPALVGFGRVQFVNRKTKKLQHTDEVASLLPLEQGSPDVDWQEALEIELTLEDLDTEPELEGGFEPLPSAAEQARSYTTWRKRFSDTLYRTRTFELFRSPGLGLLSEPGESERDFRIRLGELAREKRDRLAERLREKYGRRVSRLEERIRKAELVVSREQEQAKGQKMQTAISMGAAVLSAFLGRKKVSLGTLGRATTAARGVGRVAREKQDVQRAARNLEAYRAQLVELNGELEEELDRLEDTLDPVREELESVAVRPRRSDVDVRAVALAWAPHSSSGPLWR